jgi:hypothetical protein
MPRIEVPKLGASVGEGAANNPADVEVVQALLNKAIINGDLIGFLAGPVDGKASGRLVQMIALYQARHGIRVTGKDHKPRAIIEPGSPTLTLLARNPLADARWSEYDQVIKQEVDDYNQRLHSVSHFEKLDWRWVKAIVWTEVKAGPDSPAWSQRPMQIGNTGDPGLNVVLNGLDHSGLVVPARVRTELKSGTTGSANIRAGVAYLYHCAALPYYRYSEVVDSRTIETYRLAPGETLSAVAPRLGTTVDEILRQSGLDAARASKLPVGAKLKYRKAHQAWQVTGWLAWDKAIHDYNGGGDPEYVSKVTKAYAKITSYWTQ